VARVVLDTNVFVAAGFRPRSASGRLLRAVAVGHLVLVWDEHTRRETEHVIGIIAPLDDALLDDVFREEHRFAGLTHPERFAAVPDPADRVFAALTGAAGATLVSRDDHLLSQRSVLHFPVMPPSEAAAHLLSDA
jgi:uncharacterized protein